jgi:proteic killer suppression protein
MMYVPARRLASDAAIRRRPQPDQRRSGDTDFENAVLGSDSVHADTVALAEGQRVRRFLSFESVARRKFRQLQIAGKLHDLRAPPGYRLEALKGDRAGQHSIRINDQYRICFHWTGSNAVNVEITDYH